jgi:nucleoside-diphosphate-sugar epimerase
MPPGVDRGPIVVTGAAGFLGREVVRQALAAGFPVRALVRRAPPLEDPLPVEYRAGDLLEPGTLKGALSGASAVVHAAGRAHLFRGESTPGQLSRDNPEAAAAVVRAAKEAGAVRVVLASSISVYGPARDPRERDESAPLGPTSAYAASKLEAERRACEIAAGAGAPRLVILRLATLYGPRDPGNVRRLIRAIDRGRFVAIGDGSTRKSLLAVSDAALACLAAIGMPEGAESGPGVYNVAAAPCTMGEVVGLIYRHLGRALPRLRVPAPLALALARVARAAGMAGAAESVEKLLRDDAFSGARFSAAAGWRPRVSLGEGLREEVAWYRETLAARSGAGR